MLPSISHKQLIRILKQLGYIVSRQKGSHIRMVANNKISVTVPKHDSIAKGTLRKIMRDTNTSIQKLTELLRNN